MPITPPVEAIFWMTTLGTQRGWPGTSSLQFEWRIRTGFFDILNASNAVQSPACATSTDMPTIVHSLDHSSSKLTDSASTSFHATISQQSADVICELGNTQTETVEQIDIVDFLKEHPSSRYATTKIGPDFISDVRLKPSIRFLAVAHFDKSCD